MASAKSAARVGRTGEDDKIKDAIGNELLHWPGRNCRNYGIIYLQIYTAGNPARANLRINELLLWERQ